MQRLRKRHDFLAVRKGCKVHGRVLTLQALRRNEPAMAAITEARIGLTVTKRESGAVGRNRIRRRLRAALQLAGQAADGHYDYVVLGRHAALAAPFAALVTELQSAFQRVHRAASETVSVRKPPQGHKARR